MDSSTDQPVDPHRRLKEYEDPHFHDADDLESPEAESNAKPAAGKRKPGQRLPPVRRHYED
jgi:hypothetical protein